MRPSPPRPSPPLPANWLPLPRPPLLSNTSASPSTFGLDFPHSPPTFVIFSYPLKPPNTVFCFVICFVHCYNHSCHLLSSSCCRLPHDPTCRRQCLIKDGEGFMWGAFGGDSSLSIMLQCWLLDFFILCMIIQPSTDICTDSKFTHCCKQ